ncbi:hypothetical protein [Sporomusa sphaeroides]|uniref:Uncharacterized protein n=1 Tax=Sporomusa sphaeroides DSM 2875 TaxID=1337886 RepID=A0A1U7M9U8_9FIRM|nr:hypothetical protein [Sporomusa sphaeroides]OLS54330.1 hypothetical protein SPSPH_45760 [Sporomusa sphaeroides DSM 2875]CVK21559.1 hypothetical protein SSPH_04251 [Sporomusa sphaeroides DSM 2875]
MEFVERLNMDAVRNACIKNNFCTRMNNEAYSSMLMVAEREINSHEELIDAIKEMASRIYSCSADPNNYLMLENVTGILFRECVDRFVK